MGTSRNAHDEAFFFLRRNHMIFRLSHAEWDNPKPVKYLLDCQSIRSELADFLRDEVASVKTLGYLGPTDCVKFHGLRQIDRPWGWKDPRNTFTLPIWTDVFRDASVIHICRHGVDVAYSLWYREQHRQKPLRNKLFSCRCTSLERAFSLWLEYESMCVDVTEALPDHRTLRIRYEDLALHPRALVRRISRFLSLIFDGHAVENATQAVRADRVFSFLKNEELRNLYRRKRDHPLMKLYGYHEIPKS